MSNSNKIYLTVGVLVCLAALRLFLLGAYPLMDTTEARYAEIGRKMVELNDWITPWFDYSDPFWGKPPASFWMTAISFKLFGINEFTARLPHYLCGILILVLFWRWANRIHPRLGFPALTILSTMVLYVGSSGLVMTDMWLLLSTTLSMIAFWDATNTSTFQKTNSAWFFLGIVLGLLSKGPLALVMIGAPIFVWAVVSKNMMKTWHSLPWVKGILVTLATTLPWYIAAEIKTPGFLEYFIIGEHFNRFITPGWQGDLYGSAHDQPYGTIWLYLFADTLPWSLLLLPLPVFAWIKYGYRPKGRAFLKNPTNLYLLLWAFFPAVFFTFAGNILWPYVLPGLPALALLAAKLLIANPDLPEKTRTNVLLTGSIMSLCICLAITAQLTLGSTPEARSVKKLVAHYASRKLPYERLFFHEEKPFSADFYTKGSAKVFADYSALKQECQDNSCFIAFKSNRARGLPEEFSQHLADPEPIGRYILYRWKISAT